jgi:rare lipoprotein A
MSMRAPLMPVALLLLALSEPLAAFAPEEGLASWYGGKFQGRRTASGEIFDTNQFTAAHKTLPFGTMVAVTNLDNDKTTVVRINDRGPFIAGRIIDLSRAAAAAIGMTGKGVAPVRIEPAPPRAQAPAGTCSIQLGAFRTRSHADRLASRLAGAGFAARIEEAAGGIHRVLVAGVAESELEAARRSLREAGFTDQLVRVEPLAAAP